MGLVADAAAAAAIALLPHLIAKGGLRALSFSLSFPTPLRQKEEKGHCKKREQEEEEATLCSLTLSTARRTNAW